MTPLNRKPPHGRVSQTTWHYNFCVSMTLFLTFVAIVERLGQFANEFLCGNRIRASNATPTPSFNRLQPTALIEERDRQQDCAEHDKRGDAIAALQCADVE